MGKPQSSTSLKLCTNKLRRIRGNTKQIDFHLKWNLRLVTSNRFSFEDNLRLFDFNKTLGHYFNISVKLEPWRPFRFATAVPPALFQYLPPSVANPRLCMPVSTVRFWVPWKQDSLLHAFICLFLALLGFSLVALSSGCSLSCCGL